MVGLSAFLNQLNLKIKIKKRLNIVYVLAIRDRALPKFTTGLKLGGKRGTFGNRAYTTITASPATRRSTPLRSATIKDTDASTR
jgi:hypothetical protein